MHVIQNGAIVINHKGLIEAVGTEEELKEKFASASFETDIDASGKVVLPGLRLLKPLISHSKSQLKGLVDGHTHPIWSGDRVHEFAMKLAGMNYMQVINRLLRESFSQSII